MVEVEGMVELYTARSTNGRWGVSIVGPEGTKFPAEGQLIHVGQVAGMEVFRYTPGNTGQWIAVFGECEAIAGAAIAYETDLQSHNHVSVVVMGPQAVLKSYGYKRRSSSVTAYIDGQELADVPPAILAAVGLIPAENGGREIPTPPTVSNSLAEAFAKAKAKARE